MLSVIYGSNEPLVVQIVNSKALYQNGFMSARATDVWQRWLDDRGGGYQFPVKTSSRRHIRFYCVLKQWSCGSIASGISFSLLEHGYLDSIHRYSPSQFLVLNWKVFQEKLRNRFTIRFYCIISFQFNILIHIYRF